MTTKRQGAGILAFIAIIANTATGAFARELSTEEAVHALAVTLTEAGEKAFNKNGRFPSPQILFGIGGTYAYGSCQSASGSTRIPGSFYCAKTNTIVLEYKQLEYLRSRFGDGAVVYALAHEYAHYIQKVFGLSQNITRQELQADCIAGATLSSFADALQLNQKDIDEIVTTASAIGGGTHGTPEQRANAVKHGLKHRDISACGFKASPAASTQNSTSFNSGSKPKESTPAAKPNQKTPQRKASSTKRICTTGYSLGGNTKGFNACYSVRKTLPNGDRFIVIFLTHPSDSYLHKMATTDYKNGYQFIVLSCSQRQAHLAYEDGRLMKDNSPTPNSLSDLWNWHGIDNESSSKDYHPFQQENRTLRGLCN